MHNNRKTITDEVVSALIARPFMITLKRISMCRRICYGENVKARDRTNDLSRASSEISSRKQLPTWVSNVSSFFSLLLLSSLSRSLFFSTHTRTTPANYLRRTTIPQLTILILSTGSPINSKSNFSWRKCRGSDSLGVTSDREDGIFRDEQITADKQRAKSYSSVNLGYFIPIEF